MKSKISDLMLERYRLGELNPEDYTIMEKAATSNSELRSRLESLDGSDRELRIRYPSEYFSFDKLQAPKRAGTWKLKSPANLIRIAALISICILLPVVYFATGRTQKSEGELTGLSGYTADRAKGNAREHSELSLYLKGDRENTLPEETILREGNTVQLAYLVPSGERYGVIYSIDGRSIVTLHYPYGEGQSSLLVSGRRTFLSEAYTLDDAPKFEIFVMVISDEPLNTGVILLEAQKTARTSNLASMEEKSREVFKNYEVETVTVLKE